MNYEMERLKRHILLTRPPPSYPLLSPFGSNLGQSTFQALGKQHAKTAQSLVALSGSLARVVIQNFSQNPSNINILTDTQQAVFTPKTPLQNQSSKVRCHRSRAFFFAREQGVDGRPHLPPFALPPLPFCDHWKNNLGGDSATD